MPNVHPSRLVTVIPDPPYPPHVLPTGLKVSLVPAPLPVVEFRVATSRPVVWPELPPHAPVEFQPHAHPPAAAKLRVHPPTHLSVPAAHAKQRSVTPTTPALRST